MYTNGHVVETLRFPSVAPQYRVIVPHKGRNFDTLTGMPIVEGVNIDLQIAERFRLGQVSPAWKVSSVQQAA